MSSALAERTTSRTDPVATLHDSLASMCRSGVPLPRAFAMLVPDLRRGPLRDAMEGLAQDLDQGVPLDEAYARRCEAFPPAYAALLSAGIASGDVPGALAEIARHAERRARVSRSLRRALAGPLLSAAFVVVVGVVLLAVVGPRFQDVRAIVHLDVTSLTGGASGPRFMSDTRLMIATGCVAALALGALVAFLYAWKRSPIDGAEGAAALGLRWPVLGRIRLYAGLSGLLTTLASLVRRGVPLPEALDLVAQTAEEPRLRGNVVRMASVAHEGAGLEAAARSAELLPPSELWLVRAAEERGAPEEALDDLAAHYTDRLERCVARTSAVLKPAAELAVGGVVFVLAYTFVVPITELAVDLLSWF